MREEEIPLRVVILTRAPRWYPFRGDRMARRFAQAGYTVVGIVVEPVGTWITVREWCARLGLRLVLTKCFEKVVSYFRHPSATRLDRFGSLVTQEKRRAPFVFWVTAHNSRECLEKLCLLQPDVVVLRGCGILRGPVLAVARIATLNPHYGFLPAYRGVDVTEWAVLQGDPVGVSVHQVTEGVDTGPIWIARRITPSSKDTLEVLREKSAVLAVELLVEALNGLVAGTLMPIAQDVTVGQQYFRMHPRLRRLAQERLRRC